MEQEKEGYVTEEKVENSMDHKMEATTDEIKNLAEKVAVLDQKCKDLQDQYLRARAELDNAHKRFVRDKEDLRVLTIQSVLGEVINVFDAFKMGLMSVEQQNVAAEVLGGFKMVLQQFQSSLTKFGIVSIEPKEEAFNPHLHEAVSAIHHDSIPEGHIVQFIRTGYCLGDRLLRPASVIVSQGKAPENPQSQS